MVRHTVRAAAEAQHKVKEHLCKRAAPPEVSEPKQGKKGVRTGSGPTCSAELSSVKKTSPGRSGKGCRVPGVEAQTG